MQFLYHLLVAAVIFSLIDLFWLSLVANKVYRRLMKGLVREKFLAGPAVLFYAIYIVGMVVFAIQPALADKKLPEAIGLGALFGLVCYATYDLTNLATLKNWSQKLSVIDMAWGTVLSATVAALTYALFA